MSEARQIYFMHVPKAGGTSLRRMLESKFDDSNVFPTRAMLRKTPKVYNDPQVFRRVFLDSGRSDWDMISSHIPFFQIRDLLANDALKITVMREPLSRAISEITHHRSHAAKWAEKSFDEIVYEHKMVYRKRFGVGSYFGRQPRGARANLARFDVIGLQSRFEDTVDVVEHATGLELVVEHSNRGDRGESDPTTVSLAALYELQEALEADSHLYALACFKFHQQLAATRRTRVASDS